LNPFTLYKHPERRKKEKKKRAIAVNVKGALDQILSMCLFVEKHMMGEE